MVRIHKHRWNARNTTLLVRDATSTSTSSLNGTSAVPESAASPHPSGTDTTLTSKASASRPCSPTTNPASSDPQPTAECAASPSSSLASTEATLKRTRYTDNALHYAITAIDVAEKVTSVLTFIPSPVGTALKAALCILRIVRVGEVTYRVGPDVELDSEEDGRQHKTWTEAH